MIGFALRHSQMTSFKTLFIFCAFIALIFTQIKADSADISIADADTVANVAKEASNLAELAQLKSKIHILESFIKEKNEELKGKDDAISKLGKMIKEKSDSIALLQSEIASLRKKGTTDAEELVGKAHARAIELETLVEKLDKEINVKNKEKEALEARAIEKEKKVLDLSSEFDNLQNIINEQKSKLQKTERALQIAEEEMMKAKFEATSRTNELMEVHGVWLPPWFAVHLTRYQTLLEKHWKEHGKPTADALIQKAVEKKAQAEIWTRPHIENIKTKWIPAIKEQWLILATNVEPHVHSISKKTLEVYEESKTAIAPLVIKVQELADPYFQEVKKISKPYIDQVATAAKPHVDRVRVVMKPYTEEAVHVYVKCLECASTYHHRVQGTVQEKLQKHELTRPLATKELVWFIASALLALPITIGFKIFSSICCKKTKNSTRNSQSNHSRRKAKRGHPDK
ncbi:hypothetical protein ACH5RR_040931 [Cinchona calisaya]|uniref:Uncharacterized protein n=1 Tax=Cinchona calisaya TaxID=153742 RepID=A0ABD2XY58_9GENT